MNRAFKSETLMQRIGDCLIAGVAIMAFLFTGGVVAAFIVRIVLWGWKLGCLLAN